MAGSGPSNGSGSAKTASPAVNEPVSPSTADLLAQATKILAQNNEGTLPIRADKVLAYSDGWLAVDVYQGGPGAYAIFHIVNGKLNCEYAADDLHVPGRTLADIVSNLTQEGIPVAMQAGVTGLSAAQVVASQQDPSYIPVPGQPVIKGLGAAFLNDGLSTDEVDRIQMALGQFYGSGVTTIQVGTDMNDGTENGTQTWAVSMTLDSKTKKLLTITIVSDGTLDGVMSIAVSDPDGSNSQPVPVPSPGQ